MQIKSAWSDGRAAPAPCLALQKVLCRKWHSHLAGCFTCHHSKSKANTSFPRNCMCQHILTLREGKNPKQESNECRRVSVLQTGRGDKTCPRPKGTKVAGVRQGPPTQTLMGIVPLCSVSEVASRQRQLHPRGWVPQSAQLHWVQLLTKSSPTPAWVQWHRPGGTQGLGLLPLRHTSTLHSEPQKTGKFEQGLLCFLLEGFLLRDAAITAALSSVALGAISGSCQKPPALQKEAQDCSVPSIYNHKSSFRAKGVTGAGENESEEGIVQQCTLMAMYTNHIPGCLSKGKVSKVRELVISFYLVLGRLCLGYHVQFGSLTATELDEE